MGCSHTIIPASEGHLFACPGSRIGSRVRWIRAYGRRAARRAFFLRGIVDHLLSEQRLDRRQLGRPRVRHRGGRAHEWLRGHLGVGDVLSCRLRNLRPERSVTFGCRLARVESLACGCERRGSGGIPVNFASNSRRRPSACTRWVVTDLEHASPADTQRVRLGRLRFCHPTTRRRCRSFNGMMWFVHSRRSVPTSRSAIAFAFGAHTGVSTGLIPIACARAMKPPP